MERLTFEVTSLGRMADHDGGKVVEVFSEETTIAFSMSGAIALNLAMALLPSAADDATQVAWKAQQVTLARDEAGSLILMLDLGRRRLPVQLPPEGPAVLHALLSELLREGPPAPRH